MSETRKPRLLLVNEFSALASGYATYGMEVQRRLHATGKYEIAELACFGSPEDPRRYELPWKYFPNLPSQGMGDDRARYESKESNQFGEWSFDDVVLRFRPDVVWDFRDVWMAAFEQTSPHRRHYHHVLMAPVDAIPQQEQWLDTCMSADAVLTYTDWGQGVLRDEGGGLIRLRGTAAPGADLGTFRPMQRADVRKKFGFSGDEFIVGCFAPSTPITLSDYSVRSIEDVGVGDHVIDGQGGVGTVSATHSFASNKPMVSVSVVGEPEPICCTRDHEWMVVPRDQVMSRICSNGQKAFHSPHTKTYVPSKHDVLWEPRWVEARDLEVGDFTAFRIPSRVEDADCITHDGFTVPLNEDFCLLAGFYLANGSISSSSDCSNHSIQLSFNPTNRVTPTVLQDACVRLLGYTPRISPERVEINHAPYTRLMLHYFGRYASKKHLPESFAWLPPPKQLAVVRGWQMGDGCDDKSGNRNIGISINLSLLQWMRMALLRNGIVSSIHKRNMSIAEGLFPNAKQQWRLTERGGGRYWRQFIHNGWFFSPIKKVDLDVEAGDRVYDLTVESSHSYSVLCKCVHNTVMRNQPRKLFPQLIADFASFVRAADTDLARRSFLYLHTSYPDNGWDIPKLIKQSGISHRILVTYRCRMCGVVFPSLFQDARGVCVKCGKPTATMPNVEHFIGRESLAAVANLFDIYVQYSCAEGLGMPLVEAAACGVPVMAVDYSGMSDVVRKLDGYPIRVSHFDVEPGSDRMMARPDGGDLVRKLLHFASLGESQRAEQAFRARRGAERHYTWEGAAAAWMEVFDSLPLRPWSETWESPPRIHRPGQMPAVFPSHEAFVRWGFENLVGRPEMAGGYAALRMVRDLNWGWTHQTGVSYLSEESYLGQRKKSRPFGITEATAELLGMCEYYNEGEEKRCRTSNSSNRC